jgi:hypothetical protein
MVDLLNKQIADLAAQRDAEKQRAEANAKNDKAKLEGKGKTIPVTAIANGYYGGKVRVPGEKFSILSDVDFSGQWMSKDPRDAPPQERFVPIGGGVDGVVGKTVELGSAEDASPNDARTRDKASSRSNDK